MKKNENQFPRVGVGVMIFKNGKLLLARRKGSHGSGEYAFPGGHLEYMESFEECAMRETKEECGIEIDNIKFLYIGDLRVYSPKHYIQVSVIADWKSGVPEILEPDKCDGWDWYDMDNLPGPLFSTIQTAIDSYRSDKKYYKKEDFIRNGKKKSKK